MDTVDNPKDAERVLDLMCADDEVFFAFLRHACTKPVRENAPHLALDLLRRYLSFHGVRDAALSAAGGDLGLADVVRRSFQAGFAAVAGRPMSAAGERRPDRHHVVEVKPGEDRIAKCAAELDL